ncbi:response regulator [Paracoccus rhizosphaerae]|uniref:Response regulator n=1 Tax=Paracoccus rhizosphaerae TaxID=1133347 RepID=A0ABV6CIN5_9RHOB|nr:response regulator [Paracoccus rhizosphaerae]
MSASSAPVLVVISDSAVRDSLRFALEMEGLQVRAYADPLALLLEQDMPDQGCLVLDGLATAMEGADLVRRLRDCGIALPVILITEQTPKEEEAEEGVQLVCGKPLNSDVLVASIINALAVPATSA